MAAVAFGMAFRDASLVGTLSVAGELKGACTCSDHCGVHFKAWQLLWLFGMSNGFWGCIASGAGELRYTHMI